MKKRIRKALILTVLFVTGVSLLAMFGTRFLSDAFGQLTLSQIIFHIRVGNNSSGISFLMIGKVLLQLVLFITSFSALAWLTWAVFRPREAQKQALSLYEFCYKKVKWPFQHKRQICIFSCAILLLGLSYYALHKVDRELKVVDYVTAKQSKWFEEHYFHLDTSLKIDSKQNLIVIFLESVEQGYEDPRVYGTNLIKELTDLQKEGVSFRGYKRTPGSYFSMDGFAAQLLGVPLLRTHEGLGFDMHAKNDYSVFLKNAPSIFNLLQNNGYETIAFLPNSREFTKKGNFLEVHGFTHVLSEESWLEKGFRLNDETRGRWGFSDEFLWTRLKEWLLNRTSPDQPFGILLETVDTHFPSGHVSDKYKEFNDDRDPFRAASRMTADFIEWAKIQPWYKHTTIVIVGDHPWQDFNNPFTNLYTKKSNNREIFNVILNSKRAQTGSVIYVDGGFSPMDMAPTILDSMGIRFTSTNSKRNTTNEGTRIGIGVSLFSTDQNLLSTLGSSQFIKEMNQPSDFYNRLF